MKLNIRITAMRLASLLVLASILCLGMMPAMCAEKTITDMDGRTVTVSEPLERVVTAGYGIGECVMAAFGMGDKIVGTGVHPDTPGTVTFVLPAIKKALPYLGYGGTLNVEAAVNLSPDVIILEKDCAGQGDAAEAYAKLIDKLSLFNKSIPLVVIDNPACFDKPSPDSVYKEIMIMGDLFDKQNRAHEIVELLKEEVAMVSERTNDIKPEERPSVLLMSIIAKKANSSDNKLALILPDYDCGTLYPEITKVKNIYTEKNRVYMSSEQLLTLDPDAIILMCRMTTLYNSSGYKALQGMRAIKEKKVYTLGRLENSRQMAGLEFPIEMLIEAKIAYPDKFKDINVGEQLTKHCKALYGLDDAQVKTLKEAMGLDWMDEQGF